MQERARLKALRESMPEEDEFEPDERKPGTGRFQKVHKEQSFHSGVQLGEQGFKLKVQGGKEDFLSQLRRSFT